MKTWFMISSGFHAFVKYSWRRGFKVAYGDAWVLDYSFLPGKHSLMSGPHFWTAFTDPFQHQQPTSSGETNGPWVMIDVPSVSFLPIPCDIVIKYQGSLPIGFFQADPLSPMFLEPNPHPPGVLYSGSAQLTPSLHLNRAFAALDPCLPKYPQRGGCHHLPAPLLFAWVSCHTSCFSNHQRSANRRIFPLRAALSPFFTTSTT